MMGRITGGLSPQMQAPPQRRSGKLNRNVATPQLQRAQPPNNIFGQGRNIADIFGQGGGGSPFDMIRSLIGSGGFPGFGGQFPGGGQSGQRNPVFGQGQPGGPGINLGADVFQGPIGFVPYNSPLADNNADLGRNLFNRPQPVSPAQGGFNQSNGGFGAGVLKTPQQPFRSHVGFPQRPPKVF